jgi:NDP-sugar pyrophosphorylase family protein
VFAGLEKGKPLDMPDLLSWLLNQDEHVSVFPIGEYWRDIGRIEDLERARTEFSAVEQEI